MQARHILVGLAVMLALCAGAWGQRQGAPMAPRGGAIATPPPPPPRTLVTLVERSSVVALGRFRGAPDAVTGHAFFAVEQLIKGEVTAAELEIDLEPAIAQRSAPGEAELAAQEQIVFLVRSPDGYEPVNPFLPMVAAQPPLPEAQGPVAIASMGRDAVAAGMGHALAAGLAGRQARTDVDLLAGDDCSATDKVLAGLTASSDETIRARTLYALAARDQPHGVELLRQRLLEPAAAPHITEADGGNRGVDLNAAPALARLAKDSDARVRAAVMRTLGDDPLAPRQVLQQGLNDKDFEVRHMAAASLGKITHQPQYGPADAEAFQADENADLRFWKAYLAAQERSPAQAAAAGLVCGPLCLADDIIEGRNIESTFAGSMLALGASDLTPVQAPPAGLARPLAAGAVFTVAGIWQDGDGYRATLHFRHHASDGTLRLTPILYMADGTRAVLATAELGPDSNYDLDLGAALDALPPEVAAHRSKAGLLAVEYDTHFSAFAFGQIEQRGPNGFDELRDLSGRAEPAAEAASGQAPDGDREAAPLQTVWSEPGAGGRLWIAFANPTEADLQVSWQLTGALGTTLPAQRAMLAPHTVQVAILNQALAALPAAERGGGAILIAGAAPRRFLASAGFDAAGASAALPLTVKGRGTAPPARHSEYLMGLPASPGVALRLSLHSWLDGPVTVELREWAGGTTPGPAVALPPVTIPARSTVELGLEPPAAGAAAGFLNLEVSYDGHTGDVDPAVDAIGADTVVTLWNPTPGTQAVMVKLAGPDGADAYALHVNLSPGASMRFDLGALRAAGATDRDGNAFPAAGWGGLDIGGEPVPCRTRPCAGAVNLRTGMVVGTFAVQATEVIQPTATPPQ